MFKKIFGEREVRVSISGMLRKRKRIKKITLLACLLVIAGGLFQFVTQGPNFGKAWTRNTVLKTFSVNVGNTSGVQNIKFSASHYIDSLRNEDLDIEGYDVTIEGDSNGNGGCDVNDVREYPFFGVNHFRSLTVNNCAILTHSALRVDMNDFNTTTMELNTSSPYLGVNKKVDLVIDKTLTLGFGATINVDGKGYPGSGGTTHKDGYGPGHGHGGQYPNTPQNERGNCAGSGGGYGGNGGHGDEQYGEAADPQGFGLNPTFLSGGIAYNGVNHGSGGGAGCKQNGVCTDGGAGGGIIKIKARAINLNSAISQITADGISAHETCDSGGGGTGWQVCAYGGGGSGGSIAIEAKEFINFHHDSPISTAGGEAASHDGVITSNNPSVVYNIMARGGSSKAHWSDGNRTVLGGGGGGGIINIIINPRSTLSRQKIITIESVDTNYGNPYYMGEGPTYQIELKIAGLTTGKAVTIRDELVCDPIDNSPSQPGGVAPTITETDITWPNYVPKGWFGTDTGEEDGTSDFSYRCNYY